MQFIPTMIASFVLALALTPFARRLAQRFDVLDQPSSRKFHTAATPYLGGLAIYGGMALALAIFSPRDYLVETLAIGAGASWLALIGLIDDRNGLPPRQKFLAQFVAGGVLVLAGVSVRLTDIPLLDAALTILFVVTVTNALNFLDNMDGLAAGLAGIASGIFFILAVGEGQGLVSSLAAAICGASIGFLIFNFNPASIFMGDMGALVLGFMLAVLAIKLRFNAMFSISTWSVPLLVLGLPLFDITLVIFTRLREGRPLTDAGKDHTSHRLVQMGLSPRNAVLVLYAVCVALGVMAVIVNRNPPETATTLILLTGGAAAAAFLGLEVFRYRQQRGRHD